MIKDLQPIVKKAGLAILNYYKKNCQVNIKNDGSPVTEADMASHHIISQALEQCYNFPILSEESTSISYETRNSWQTYWLIDPLDGTKDFIKKTDEFAINIALMQNKRPIFGLIYLPFFDELYYATKDQGAYCNGQKIYNERKSTNLVAIDSRNNSSRQNNSFLAKNNIKVAKRCGSSMKFCFLAKGEVDLYIRHYPTSEWDTAAAHIILEESGCELIDLSTGKTMSYNKQSLINNFFIAKRKNLNLNF